MVLICGSAIAPALVPAGARTLPDIAGSAKVRGMNNADLIVATLKAAGIDHGFGIPSGNVLPLIEAMRKGGIEFVLTAHEGSAGFAADVMGRQTGRPGLGIATLGPGATNLATGVGDAFLDRSPMIAITCNLNRDQLGRRIQMLIDHHTLFRPITKASFALRPGRVGETVAAAVRIALTEPQGPVHLDLPEDVALAPAEEGLPALEDVSAPDAPSPDSVACAAARIAEAWRPLAVIGTTAMRLRDPGLLRAVVERHDLPFATTTMAKGTIDEDHPLSVGCIERGCRQIQRRFLAGADLIVGLGYDPIEVEYEAWIGATPLVHVDIEPADTDGSVDIAHQTVGDLDSILEGFARATPASNDWTRSEIGAHRDAFQASLRPDAPGFTPHRAIDVVRGALPADGILAFDVGAHTHQIASQWTAHAPRSFLITNGWSSMGFGLPAAIAAKLAEPDRPAVCLIGDGCFQMTCGELATAKRMGLALPVVVLNDGWLGLIKVKQMRRQYAYVGTALGTASGPDEGSTPEHYFGVKAVGVGTPEHLAGALEAALAVDEPRVIEAFVDPTHYDDTVFD